jgi:hypothetical protein
MSNKKSMITGQKACGNEYRMFSIVSEDLNVLKSVKRWCRKNFISKHCVSEGYLNTKPMSVLNIFEDNPKIKILIGLTDDSDSMALKLTIDSVEEIDMWESKVKFSVYDMVE